MGEFYELRNFMNTWSQEEQQQQELHESFVNRLYECKPVKSNNIPSHLFITFQKTHLYQGHGNLYKVWNRFSFDFKV